MSTILDCLESAWLVSSRAGHGAEARADQQADSRVEPRSHRGRPKIGQRHEPRPPIRPAERAEDVVPRAISDDMISG